MGQSVAEAGAIAKGLKKKHAIMNPINIFFFSTILSPNYEF
jgi:hypothetical protein